MTINQRAHLLAVVTSAAIIGFIYLSLVMPGLAVGIVAAAIVVAMYCGIVHLIRMIIDPDYF